MNFHTQYKRSPNFDDALALAEYTVKDQTRGGAAKMPSGHSVDDDDLQGWASWASRQDMIRSYSAAFSEEYEVSELATAASSLAKEQLQGEWILGVHTSNSGNAHIHIAQAGTESQLFMDGNDIERLRRDLATKMGEPY